MARPRAFDEGEVLDRAMNVFWRQGYDGASMADLVQAMGINSPSIYVAFGSKRGLFDAVLDRYQARRSWHKASVLAGTTARESAERMLQGAIDWLTDPAEPPGCLLVQSGLSTGTGNPEIPNLLADRRGGVEPLLTERFRRGQAEGDLAPDADPAALARYINLVFLGLCVQAAAGTDREALRAAADTAMRGWPG